MKVYISGGITGIGNYKERFDAAEEYLKAQGYKVFNPTCLPPIFEWKQFMALDLLALCFCDTIYMLEGWESSRGAQLEYKEAVRLKLNIMFEKTN